MTWFCMVSDSGCMLTAKSSGVLGGAGFSPGGKNSHREPTFGPASAETVVLLPVSMMHFLTVSGPSNLMASTLSLPLASATTAKTPPLAGCSPGLTLRQSIAPLAASSSSARRFVTASAPWNGAFEPLLPDPPVVAQAASNIVGTSSRFFMAASYQMGRRFEKGRVL